MRQAIRSSWKYFLIYKGIIFLFSLKIVGQENPYYHGFPKKFPVSENESIVIESTGTSGTGANIDVLYHKIYWRINPDSTKYIRGFVQTNFRTIQANVSSISFDLRSVLVIDSIIFQDQQLASGDIIRTGNIVTILLGSSLGDNVIDSFIVYYRGVPPNVSGAAQGYQRGMSSTAGNYITTLSESYEDRDWWPCKADMQDKIDSMDITVSVPWASPNPADTFWVATNGKMVDSTIIENSRHFVFKTRYPIASYLVFVSVARFAKYYRSVAVNNISIPVVYNLLSGKTVSTYNNILNEMDKMNPLLQKFSERFSDYPFKNEKHGYYDGLLGAGGMEHQTMSGIHNNSLQSPRTLAHELMHQWFGDNVTFATWNDLWLAEGFARYSEALAAEIEPSLGLNPFSIRNSVKNTALAITSTSAWIPNANTGTSALIWSTNYGSAIYERGCMIVSMLRSICGDQKFFSALSDYQISLAGKTATTDTLKNFFNRHLNRDLTAFFADYVGGSGPATTPTGGVGHPNNIINWNSPSSNKLVLQVASQTRSSGTNVSYFRGPIVLHIRGALATEDTTICFFDWSGGNLSYAGNGLSLPVAGNRLSYQLSFNPIQVIYDDSARTLSTGSTNPSPGLDSYTWLGTTNADWNTASNWLGGQVPPDGADIVIATVGSNQPVLSGNVRIGPLLINGSNHISIGPYTLTLSNTVRGTGMLTGSPVSNLVVSDAAGIINFNQANASTRSLNMLSLENNASATIGAGIVELFGGLNLPRGAHLNVNTNNLIIH